MSDINFYNNYVNNFIDVYSEFTKYIKENFNECFIQYSTKIFEAHPEIKYIAFRYYTPSYQDGDVCHRRFNGLYFITESDIVEYDGADIVDLVNEDIGYDFKFNDDIKDFADLFDKNIKRKMIIDCIEDLYYEDMFIYTMKNKNGEVVIISEEYDCGY